MKFRINWKGASSDINVLKKKIEEDAAAKKDIALLEQKITELKVALDERHVPPTNSGNILNKPFEAKCCIVGIGTNKAGIQRFIRDFQVEVHLRNSPR